MSKGVVVVPCSEKPRTWKRSTSTWPCTISWIAPVAVEGEDNRLVGGEELDEARLVHAVRVELAGEERHKVHDVDDAHLELRRSSRSQCAAATVSRVGMSPAHPDDVGLLTFGHVGSPLPDGGARAWCSIAASMSSHCSWGCLSIAMRLT